MTGATLPGGVVVTLWNLVGIPAAINNSIQLGERAKRLRQDHPKVNAMKRRYSKQRMEKKRGAMDAMCRTQIDLCEQQAESEVQSRKQQLESEVRISLGLPEQKAPELTEQVSMPEGRVSSPAIQAEIDRRVALALETRRVKFRSPDRPLKRRLVRRRRLAMSGIREHLEASSRPSAPNVISFPGPKRA
jgi:hypothetical protein